MIHMKISRDDLVDNSDKIEDIKNELTLSLLHATQTPAAAARNHSCIQQTETR